MARDAPLQAADAIDTVISTDLDEAVVSLCPRTKLKAAIDYHFDCQDARTSRASFGQCNLFRELGAAERLIRRATAAVASDGDTGS